MKTYVYEANNKIYLRDSLQEVGVLFHIVEQSLRTMETVLRPWKIYGEDAYYLDVLDNLDEKYQTLLPQYNAQLIIDELKKKFNRVKSDIKIEWREKDHFIYRCDSISYLRASGFSKEQAKSLIALDNKELQDYENFGYISRNIYNLLSPLQKLKIKARSKKEESIPEFRNLDKIVPEETNPIEELSTKIYEEFKLGETLIGKEINTRLQTILDNLKIKKRATITMLYKYFVIYYEARKNQYTLVRRL